MSAELATLLTFRTTFRVMSADRVLDDAGLTKGLTPTPSGIQSPCGLSLRVASDQRDQALDLLADKDIEVEGVFELVDDQWQAVVA